MKKYQNSILFSLISGFLLSYLFWKISGEAFALVFPGSFIITTFGFLLLKLIFDKTDKNRTLGLIIILGFSLRLGLGVFADLRLPVIGYAEDTQKAGYLFKDAYNRDLQAWEMATSKTAFNEFFSDGNTYDQYGGLIIISTFVYKLFSPSYHNVYLILFLAAIISAIGIPFIWAMLSKNPRVQLFATLIYAFYPDSILFSASQMREPFILGLSAILFWLVSSSKIHQIKNIFMGFIVASLMLLISAKIGIFIIFLAFIWFCFDNYEFFKSKFSSKRIQLLTLFLLLGFCYISFKWIIDVGKWDALLTLNNSGWIQAIFKVLPEFFHIPFLTTYGLLQPVLPAAIVEPSIPFWKTVGIFRASGWVILSSLMIYSILFVTKKKNEMRKMWIITVALLIFWIFLSSLRAGGDMWDNPRYRLGLLVPISIISAFSIDYAIQVKDHWLWRIFAAQAVLNLIFLQWYVSRYTNVWGKLDFPVMVMLICLLISAIIGQGIVYDLKLRQSIHKAN
ncbi:MAG: hypothetical protein ACYDH1_07935 [Anaerolineaceae bacterium]